VLRRGRKFPESIARDVTTRLASEEADYVLFSGDLTTTALRAEFEAGRQLLQPLRARWGDRLLTIPGNHDRYTPRATRRLLYESLIDKHPLHAVWSRDLDATWTLVALDVCVPRLLSSRGRLDPVALERLRIVLGDLRKRGRRVIVMSHYPVAYPDRLHSSWNHVLPERERLLHLLHDSGVALYLHGHYHRRWKMESGGLTILNCGSAGYNGSTPERSPGYLRLRLSPQGLEKAEAVYLSGSRWINEAFQI